MITGVISTATPQTAQSGHSACLPFWLSYMSIFGVWLSTLSHAIHNAWRSDSWGTLWWGYILNHNFKRLFKNMVFLFETLTNNLQQSVIEIPFPSDVLVSVGQMPISIQPTNFRLFSLSHALMLPHRGTTETNPCSTQAHKLINVLADCRSEGGWQSASQWCRAYSARQQLEMRYPRGITHWRDCDIPKSVWNLCCLPNKLWAENNIIFHWSEHGTVTVCIMVRFQGPSGYGHDLTAR
jgi:hypothetical protein